MQITAIKQQVKNPERASIFLDGKYSFSLTLDQLVAEKLKNGQEIDEPTLKVLKKKSDDGKFRQRAMEWVLSRPRSVKEFKDYLYLKKVEPEIGEGLVDTFVARGYLNDETFARWWVSRRALSRRSARYIRASLIKKGISLEILNMLSIKDDEKSRLRQQIEKLKKRKRYQDEIKLKNYLVRQGYDYSLVAEVLKDA